MVHCVILNISNKGGIMEGIILVYGILIVVSMIVMFILD